MLDENTRYAVKREFQEELSDGNRNVYFSQFHSSKEFSKTNIFDIFESELDLEDIHIERRSGDCFEVYTGGSLIYIWELPQERWLFVYSTELDRRLRDDLDVLASKIGWLLNVWIPGDIVNDLYDEFTPQQESVSIERKWDPYYIYERGSEIPDSLKEYYNENYEQFVEQEIEFSLKTPKALVNKTLKEGVRDELLEKSEISESRFTFQPSQAALLNDGGVQVGNADFQSRVTIRQRGVVVHSKGEAEATFNLLDEVDSRTEYYEEFDNAIPNRTYSTSEDGSVEITEYSPGKVLKFTFTEKGYNHESSLTLLNLLTVGQSDVDLHGTVEYQNDLEFFTRTLTSYDEGEYEILFTEEDYLPTLYVRPVDGETSGLVYLFQKLKEKFDPRIKVDSCGNLPPLKEE